MIQIHEMGLSPTATIAMSSASCHCGRTGRRQTMIARPAAMSGGCAMKKKSAAETAPGWYPAMAKTTKVTWPRATAKSPATKNHHGPAEAGRCRRMPATTATPAATRTKPASVFATVMSRNPAEAANAPPATRHQNHAVRGIPLLEAMSRLAEQLGELLRVHRPPEQEPLPQMAAEIAQRVPLHLRLDAFGDDIEPKGVPKAHDRLRHGRRSDRWQGFHERAVDLELVDRQRLDAAQRRVPRAEIVDGDRDAQTAQLAQRLADLPWIFEQRRLGDLQLHPARGQPAGPQRGGDMAGEIRVVQLVAGNVDRQEPGDAVDARPAECVLERALQHPRADRHDQAALLGE